MQTRAAKRRRANDASVAENLKKKRVVLGELPNLSNPTVPATLNLQKPKCRKNSRAKKAAETKKSSPLADSNTIEPFLSDIYKYLRTMEMEKKRRPMVDYIRKVQKEVSQNMRSMLVDWLVEVADEYKLLPDTLYLSISYIDRFLSIHHVSKQRLQLLGVSSMLIASKYEEISPPDVEKFCYITDNTYTKSEVIEMEADILKSLNFEMGNPTVNTFLRRFTGIASDSENQKTPNLKFQFLCYYLAELSLLDYYCIKFLPSMLAASVIFLARFIIRPQVHPWTPTLTECLGYKAVELKECVLMLHDLHVNFEMGRGTLQAIREKYKQQKFKSVANLRSPAEIPISYFEEE